jgi:PTH1 family peptidyl-tRNA hydrolase
MKLIIGLGNPGNEYKENRHNIGFMVIDKVAEKVNLDINKNKFGGLYGDGLYKNEKILLIKPQRFINLSGEVIKPYLDFYKINIDDILIISDDLDMNVGSMKLKQSGGSGGHNGLKNIELNLGTDEYKRLKIGISNDKSISTKEYVLGNFKENEKEAIEKTVEKASDICLDFIIVPFSELMNKYNKR